MSERDFDPEDCIAALATPWGESALAVIRVSGEGSLGRLAPLFEAAGGGSLEQAGGHTLLQGFLCAPAASSRGAEAPAEERERIDQVLVAVFRGPRSFTGEDGAEIFTHGSPAIVSRALEALGRAGFRQAGPGEFTLRAFLNGKLDLTQAEAVNELVRARTDRARALALNRLSGSIEEAIRRIKQGLLELLAALEARIDYPDEDFQEPPFLDEDVEHRQQELERLLGTYRVGKVYQEGIAVVLAGQTNSGKSTLFNRLLREERAIVSEVHGTTRDYLEGFVSLEGIPVRLYDTAGYREARDEIEREGIRRTDSIAANAHVLLYLVDASRELSPADRAYLQGAEARQSPAVIPVWSKADLAAEGTPGGGGVGKAGGAGTVGLRGFLNLYALMADLGPDGLSRESVLDAVRATEDQPSFWGHAYTCDGAQIEGLPALCAPQQSIFYVEEPGTNITVNEEWIDTVALFAEAR